MQEKRHTINGFTPDIKIIRCGPPSEICDFRHPLGRNVGTYEEMLKDFLHSLIAPFQIVADMDFCDVLSSPDVTQPFIDAANQSITDFCNLYEDGNFPEIAITRIKPGDNSYRLRRVVHVREVVRNEK